MNKSNNSKIKNNVEDLISSSKIALSHLEILNNIDLKCDRVTIYRILDKLDKENKIHKIITPEGVTKYAWCLGCKDHQTHQDNHVHFLCEYCKDLVCLPIEIPNIKLDKNYKVNSIDILIKGKCINCQ